MVRPLHPAGPLRPSSPEHPLRPLRLLRPIRAVGRVRPTGAPLVRDLMVGGVAYLAGRSAVRRAGLTGLTGCQPGAGEGVPRTGPTG